VESLTSHNPIGLHGLLRDSFTFFFFLLLSNLMKNRSAVPEFNLMAKPAAVIRAPRGFVQNLMTNAVRAGTHASGRSEVLAKATGNEM
jgi:hypothetical protein